VTARSPAAGTAPPADRQLMGAALVFAVAVGLHTLDHLRRGTDSTPKDVFVAGILAFVVEVGVVVVVFMRRPEAPLVAAVAGFSLAAGYVAVHFLPARGVLSDSFTSAADTSWLSWLAGTLEVAAAVALGVAGVAAMARARRGSRRSPLKDDLFLNRGGASGPERFRE
jgi:hypothetical protein